jgi:hypothetical protein
MGVIRDPAKNTIIEFDVVNEMIGLYRSAAERGARVAAS